MANAKRDGNHVPTLLGVSSSDGVTPVIVWADDSTHRLLVDASVTINGVTGTKSNNAVVPGATNLGVLPAIATAGAPSYTESFQVGLSTDLSGALRVTGSLSVGGTTDNSAFTAGTSTGTPAMGFYHSTIDTVTDGRAAAVGITSKRAMLVTLQTSAGADTGVAAVPLQVSLANTAANATAVKVDGSAATQPVSGTVTVTQATGTSLHAVIDTGSTTAVTQATGTNLHTVVDSGTITTVSTVTSLSQFAGNAIDTNSGTKSAGTLRVVIATDQPQLTNKLLVTPDANSAINLAQVGGTNIVNGGVAGSQSIGGTVATNVAITANPINLGAQAVSSENAAVTTSRQVQLVADLVGKQIVLPYANPENFVSGVTAAMTATTSTSLIAAPASGLRNYITHIIVTNSHATVGTFVLIQDGSGGTTIYEGYCAAAGGGFSITFPTPLRQPTTATALFVQNVTTGSNTIAAASGYKGA